MSRKKPKWRLELRGGAYDGWVGACDMDPPVVLIVWECPDCDGCDGHATRDPHDPGIVLRTAESYRRTELRDEERLAVYDVGEGDPDSRVWEEELAGVGLGSGWPVSP